MLLIIAVKILMFVLKCTVFTISQFWLFQIEYPKKIYIQSINIYETYKGGSAWRISFKSPNGSWLTVWEVDRATLSTVPSSRIFSPPIQVNIKMLYEFCASLVLFFFIALMIEF